MFKSESLSSIQMTVFFLMKTDINPTFWVISSPPLLNLQLSLHPAMNVIVLVSGFREFHFVTFIDNLKM